ncbi:hypothetical protein C2G38_2138394 [Gigaspora rosea]|uniref:Uncharacterized protein n=1 Tax=Gigaspora rosea TaxID=44941 RepID=A0A397VZ18_9GLOM|nr:hypothetical protein C2G38_2138394 [Gigaspora rosea]CAG8524867.1 22862_t:CDS:1 [Gigaspora rosea]
MENANEWLNERIPKLQRVQATHLFIYRQCQNGHSIYQNDCNYCNDKMNFKYPPQYQFYSAFFEGELDLKDFVNLQHLDVYGTGPDQDQIINLKIDKCNKLTHLQFNFLPFSKITVGENKQLIANHNMLKNQVEKLTSIFRNIKDFSLVDIKEATKKMQEENLEHQVAVIKSKLTEDCQLLLETLLEAQQEVLQDDNIFARNQLEKFKEIIQ